MAASVQPVTPGQQLWPELARLFPQTVEWMRDPDDGGDYRFFAATDEGGTLLGGCVVDIGRMGFGPLADTTVGFIENVHVVEGHRRKGVGTALLDAVLEHAWGCGCDHVRGTVAYDNGAGLALYRSMGMGVIPEEDPQAEEAADYYTVVALNPARMRGRGGKGR